MSNSKNQPGLDCRHRDQNGRIEAKHGNTLVGTLRETYGDRVPANYRADMKLSTLLREERAASLSQMLRRK